MKWVLIKNLGIVSTGNTPSKSNEEFYESPDIGFIKPDIISDSGITWIDSTNEYISEKARSRARILKDNAIFVTCIGSIGKIGIARGEYAFNQQINAIETNSNVIPEYLAYCLLANKNRLHDIANAPVVPIINKTQFENFTVKVTENIGEQQKIIIILNKIGNVIKLKNEQLIQMDTLIKARFVEMFGDISIGSYKYEIRKLGDVANVGSSHRVFTTEFVDVGIPFYRGTEIGELFNGQQPSDPYYISEEHYQRLANDETRPKIGDLLMPSICNKGQVWMVDTEEPFYYKDGRVLCISADREIYDTRYLQYFMRLKTELEYPKLGSGSTFAEFKIFLLKDIDVLTPPLELQSQFAAFVHQVDKSKVA